MDRASKNKEGGSGVQKWFGQVSDRFFPTSYPYSIDSLTGIRTRSDKVVERTRPMESSPPES
jgi:hypothetical protein